MDPITTQLVIGEIAMSKYIVIEIQNGAINNNVWTYEHRDDAEAKFYQVVSAAVKSPVSVHTILLVTDEGFLIDTKCYKHEAEPYPDDQGAV